MTELTTPSQDVHYVIYCVFNWHAGTGWTDFWSNDIDVSLILIACHYTWRSRQDGT